MQKITPFLWYDKGASEAAKYYTQIFPNSNITNRWEMKDTPSGTVEVVSIKLYGQEFTLMSAGPYFKFTPAVSFIVGCETKKEIDNLWKKLGKGGKVMMPLDTYPFSERYGWTTDKFGLGWQLILTKPEGEKRPKIVPSLLFTGDTYGKAGKAREFYLSVFKKTKKGRIVNYEENAGPHTKGTVMYSDCMLENLWMALMDGPGEHAFTFNEAISFVVNCKDQKEVDYFWKKMSAVKESEQCGWIKDKFGVSWQITPQRLTELMAKDKSGRVMQAMMKMKKIVVKDLEKAYEGK